MIVFRISCIRSWHVIHCLSPLIPLGNSQCPGQGVTGFPWHIYVSWQLWPRWPSFLLKLPSMRPMTPPSAVTLKRPPPCCQKIHFEPSVNDNKAFPLFCRGQGRPPKRPVEPIIDDSGTTKPSTKRWDNQDAPMRLSSQAGSIGRNQPGALTGLIANKILPAHPPFYLHTSTWIMLQQQCVLQYSTVPSKGTTTRPHLKVKMYKYPASSHGSLV